MPLQTYLCPASSPLPGDVFIACCIHAGIEYQSVGLGAAIITHWLYDWFAFSFICSEWGGSCGSSGDAGKHGAR